VNSVAARADRIAGDVEHVGGKAVKLSTLFVDHLMTPTAKAAAILTGVRTGARFLIDGWKSRRRATSSSSSGGNHHE
jgi:hypothetical protein